MKPGPGGFDRPLAEYGLGAASGHEASAAVPAPVRTRPSGRCFPARSTKYVPAIPDSISVTRS